MKTYRIDENWGQISVTEFTNGENGRVVFQVNPRFPSTAIEQHKGTGWYTGNMELAKQWVDRHAQYEQALRNADMYWEAGFRSALKQGAADAGIPYGDKMGKYVAWAEEQLLGKTF